MAKHVFPLKNLFRLLSYVGYDTSFKLGKKHLPIEKYKLGTAILDSSN